MPIPYNHNVVFDISLLRHNSVKTKDVRGIYNTHLLDDDNGESWSERMLADLCRVSDDSKLYFFTTTYIRSGTAGCSDTFRHLQL